MERISKLTEKELVIEIFRCDKEIIKLLAIDTDKYPGAIMGLGDFYIEKSMLIDELLKRRKND